MTEMMLGKHQPTIPVAIRLLFLELFGKQGFEKLFLKSLLAEELKKEESDCDWDSRLVFSEHHLSHAASAFYPSPFERAVVLTMDGVGEWATTSAAMGESNRLEIFQEIHFPHSLGLLYSALTYFTGFKVNS